VPVVWATQVLDELAKEGIPTSFGPVYSHFDYALEASDSARALRAHFCGAFISDFSCLLERRVSVFGTIAKRSTLRWNSTTEPSRDSSRHARERRRPTGLTQRELRIASRARCRRVLQTATHSFRLSGMARSERALQRTPSKKSENLMVRVDRSSKSVIARAARLRGVSASDYVRSIVVAEARREVEESRTKALLLRPEEQLAFRRALQRPISLTRRQARAREAHARREIGGSLSRRLSLRAAHKEASASGVQLYPRVLHVRLPHSE
jgi:uncharacterized protein (DUF1778 family)